jgi:hypothetical protein
MDVPLILGCVSRKRSTPSAARDLYVSPLFERRRRYADRSGRPWVILSAAYGIVDPETVLAPYDVTLNTACPAQKRAMGECAAGQLEERFGLLMPVPMTWTEEHPLPGNNRSDPPLGPVTFPLNHGRVRADVFVPAQEQTSASSQ